MISLSSIPYASVEARYAVENRMLDAIRHGDISEATYQQNLFMGFTLDQRLPDTMRDGKDMLIAVNTAYRKAIEQAAVIAAFYSQGRDGGKIPVDYTMLRFVRKPSGAMPGKVIYTDYKTVTVQSDEELVRKLQMK